MTILSSLIPPRADTESDLHCGTEGVWLVRVVLNAETVEHELGLYGMLE